MPDFVTLSCPTCGGQLQITKDIDRFACAHCGNEHVVSRVGGIVTLAPVVEGLERIQRGTDKSAAELALRRLKEETSDAEQRFSVLADELISTDRRIVTDELRMLGKVSDWDVVKISLLLSAGSLQLEVLHELTAEELEMLNQSSRERGWFHGKPKRRSLEILELLVGLRRKLEHNSVLINKYRRELRE